MRQECSAQFSLAGVERVLLLSSTAAVAWDIFHNSVSGTVVCDVTPALACYHEFSALTAAEPYKCTYCCGINKKYRQSVTDL